MKVVQVLQKAWLEFTVCCSSMVYIIVRIVADVNKINLPEWFENFDIPTISLFLMAFILLYRSEEKYDKMSLNFVAPVLGQSWGILGC